MTKFTVSQIQEKAKSLVELNVVGAIQELIDFVNEHTPDMIPELISDAISSQEIDQEEMFAYLLRENKEDLVDLLEGWYTDEDNELEEKELLQAYHADPDVVSEEIESLYREKNEDNQPEILQYVQLENDWVAKKLRDQGEIVIELLGLDVWCRQCFGQMFHQDECWASLALEMLQQESVLFE